MRTSLAQRACLSYTSNAQGGLVYQLKSQTWFDLWCGFPGPSTEQVPGTYAETLWYKETDTNHGTGNFIGQKLPDAPFNTGGIARLKPALCFRAMGINLLVCPVRSTGVESPNESIGDRIVQ